MLFIPGLSYFRPALSTSQANQHTSTTPPVRRSRGLGEQTQIKIYSDVCEKSGWSLGSLATFVQPKL